MSIPKRDGTETYSDEEVGLSGMEEDELDSALDFFEGCLRVTFA